MNGCRVVCPYVCVGLGKYRHIPKYSYSMPWAAEVLQVRKYACNLCQKAPMCTKANVLAKKKKKNNRQKRGLGGTYKNM